MVKKSFLILYQSYNMVTNANCIQQKITTYRNLLHAVTIVLFRKKFSKKETFSALSYKTSIYTISLLLLTAQAATNEIYRWRIVLSTKEHLHVGKLGAGKQNSKHIAVVVSVMQTWCKMVLFLQQTEMCLELPHSDIMAWICYKGFFIT
jgi:hypothetical protein